MVLPGCDATQCCCLNGTFTLIQQGDNVTMTNQEFTPSTCPILQIQFTLSKPDATVASAILGSNSFRMSMAGSLLTYDDLNFPQCSGQARVGLARAVYHALQFSKDQVIVACDDPFSALDPNVTILVWKQDHRHKLRVRSQHQNDL